MTPEEVIAKLARLYDDMQHAQNPAWTRPTDEEICEVLNDVLTTIDIEYIESMKQSIRNLTIDLKISMTMCRILEDIVVMLKMNLMILRIYGRCLCSYSSSV